jgi:hypothetical protein
MRESSVVGMETRMMDVFLSMVFSTRIVKVCRIVALVSRLLDVCGFLVLSSMACLRSVKDW